MRLFSTSAEPDNKDDGNRIILDRSKVVLISRNQKVQTDIKNILKMQEEINRLKEIIEKSNLKESSGFKFE